MIRDILLYFFLILKFYIIFQFYFILLLYYFLILILWIISLIIWTCQFLGLNRILHFNFTFSIFIFFLFLILYFLFKTIFRKITYRFLTFIQGVYFFNIIFVINFWFLPQLQSGSLIWMTLILNINYTLLK